MPLDVCNVLCIYCSCNSSGFMKLVTQQHGLCTSVAVGVGACCLGIGFRHMFLAFEWRGGAWAVRLISFHWPHRRSPRLVALVGRENAQPLESRV